MIPTFVAAGGTAPAGSLAVDGPVTGAKAIYSHWQGAPDTPADLLADTSTEMLLRAAADPGRWLAPYSHVAIGHLDADGLLAAAVACRPDLARRHGGLLADAAATGDFQTWRGEPAYRLVLALHRRIIAGEASGPSPQEILDGAVRDLPDLIAEATGDPGDDPAVAAIRRGFAAIASGIVAITQVGRLATITWPRRIGHAWDPFLTTGADDDLPLHLLGAFIPDDRFQLRLETTPEGVAAGLDAPRHSWARTVVRPPVAWPDVAPLAQRLQRLEPGEARWLIRPEASARGYTGLLATDAVPSRLAPGTIQQEIATFLASSLPGR